MTGSVTEVDALVVRTSHENTFEIKPYMFSVIVNFPFSEEEIRGSMVQQFGVKLVVAASVGMLQGSTKDTKETRYFLVVCCVISSYYTEWIIFVATS
jgi:hypothetical protein